MENFFYNDNFHMDLDSLITELDLDEPGAVEALEEDWVIEVTVGALEPMFELDVLDFQEMLFNSNEDRYSEDGGEDAKILSALLNSINFEKLNSMIPKMWYGGKEEKITKKDLLEYISHVNN